MEPPISKPNLTRLPLRERNKQRISQRIEDAAFALFRRVGYEQTTMEMIAEEAEVSRGTLFNYFPAKQALLLPFMENLYNQHVQPQIMAYIATQPDIQAILRFLFHSIHEHVLVYPDIEKALQWEFFHPRVVDAEPKKYGTGFHTMLLTILRQSQQQHLIRQDLAVETLARYIGVLYLSLLYQTLGDQSTTDYDTEVEKLLAFLQAAFQG